MTFVLALTNIWRNRMRTAFTVAGVVVVVAAYLSVSYYFSMVVSRAPAKPDPLPADVVVSLGLPEPLAAKFLADHSQIESYELVAFATVSTSLGSTECLGITSGSKLLPFGEYTSGRSPGKAGEIAIPAMLASAEKVGAGGTITLASQMYGLPAKHDFTVVGVFAPKSARYAAPVMLAEDLRAIAQSRTRHMLNLKPGTNVARFASDLANDKAHVQSVETAGMLADAQNAEDWASTYGAAQSSARMLVSVVLIIAGLGVLNTMMVSVLQRRHEFGIMKACGMLESQVLSLFAQEGLILAFLGYALGVELFYGGLVVLNALGRLEVVAVTPAALITAAVQALVVCVIPSLIPAYEVMARTARELLSTH